MACVRQWGGLSVSGDHIKVLCGTNSILLWPPWCLPRPGLHRWPGSDTMEHYTGWRRRWRWCDTLILWYNLLYSVTSAHGGWIHFKWPPFLRPNHISHCYLRHTADFTRQNRPSRNQSVRNREMEGTYIEHGMEQPNLGLGLGVQLTAFRVFRSPVIFATHLQSVSVPNCFN